MGPHVGKVTQGAYKQRRQLIGLHVGKEAENHLWWACNYGRQHKEAPCLKKKTKVVGPVHM